MAKLAEIRSELVKLVEKYNDLNWDEKTKKKDLDAVDEKIAKLVKDYASLKENEVLLECKKSENPMLEAVTRLTYETVAVKDERSGEGDAQIITRVVGEKTKEIDLQKLHKKCNGIGADTNWIYILEKFNCLLTMRAAQELGLDPKEVNDSYAMDKLSKEVDLGKNPTSNTNIVKTLQTVVNSMIGDGYKVTSHDWKYIDKTYTKKSRVALTVTCGNHRQLRSIMANICHKLVTGKKYSVDYKKLQA